VRDVPQVGSYAWGRLRETGTAASTQERCWGTVNRDLTAFRAVETAFAIALVWALYALITSGALTALNQEFGGWYSGKVDGLFDVSVVDTSIKAPRLDRASFPIATVFDATVVEETVVDATVVGATHQS